MKDNQKKLYGIVGTAVFHIILIALLVLFGFDRVEPQEEEGILVMVGDVSVSTGNQVPTDPAPSPMQENIDQVVPEPSSLPASSSPEVAEELVTTDDAEAPSVDATDKKAEELKKKKKEEEARLLAQQEIQRKEEEQRKQKEAEAARLAEEKRKQEEAIKNKVANAFSGPKQDGQNGTGNTGSGAQGSPNGNSATGATTGSPGWGDFDLGGRGIRGSLPRPSFSVNESGTVVVAITVDESGKVINAIIGKGTNTASAELRNSALSAAKKAVFEIKKDVLTQSGTITYRFDSDN